MVAQIADNPAHRIHRCRPITPLAAGDQSDPFQSLSADGFSLPCLQKINTPKYERHG
jgi:hypothetical protein